MPGPSSATLNDTPPGVFRTLTRHVSIRRRILEGVLEQIGDELRQQLPIPRELRGFGRVERDVQTRAAHARRVRLDHVGRERDEMQWPPVS